MNKLRQKYFQFIFKSPGCISVNVGPHLRNKINSELGQIQKKKSTKNYIFPSKFTLTLPIARQSVSKIRHSQIYMNVK